MGRKVEEDNGVLMTLSDWKQSVELGHFNEYDGSGCWVRDGYHTTDETFDDVFTVPPVGTTHVIWFNK